LYFRFYGGLVASGTGASVVLLVISDLSAALSLHPMAKQEKATQTVANLK
jgi:hypothetical protein